jgi:hypothetical protein
MLERKQKIRETGECFPAVRTPETPDPAPFLFSHDANLPSARAMTMNFFTAVGTFLEFILC